jgi:glutamine cyclotransferase
LRTGRNKESGKFFKAPCIAAFGPMPDKKSAPRRRTTSLLLLIFLALLIAMALRAPLLDAQTVPDRAGSSPIPVFGYKIIKTYPHDTSAFTQGLVYDGGVLYEGTGKYGQSSLRRVDLDTGRVLKQTSLAGALFGEGVSVWKDRLIQLTWRSGIGFVYDKENLTKVGDFKYQTEGWGITSDGRNLIMSDGTETLHFLDPDTFKEKWQIKVEAEGVPIKGLNELEYVKGDIYANVWPTNWIVIISPETGEVKGAINLQGILQKGDGQQDSKKVDVVNGIAYDPQGDRLFVTGKLWPKIFQIELVAEDEKT